MFEEESVKRDGTKGYWSMFAICIWHL